MRCLLLLIITGISYSQVAAQSGKADPTNFYLTTVYLTNSSVHTGTWITCTGSAIHIAIPPDTVLFQPVEIHRIEIRKDNPKRSVRIGAAIGFVAGFAIGYVAFDTEGGGTDVAQLGHAAGAGLIGAFSGAIIGQVIGMMSKTHYVLGNTDQYERILPDLKKYNQ
jgi:hypothetical protein